MDISTAKSILEITEITEESVKKAFRKKSKEKHPDMGGSESEFIELQKAKEVCENYLKNGSRSYNGFSFDESFFGGEFWEYFNQYSQNRHRWKSRNDNTNNKKNNIKNKNLKITINLSLKEIILGTTKIIKYKREKTCAYCHGTGFNNVTIDSCDDCGGTGLSKENDVAKIIIPPKCEDDVIVMKGYGNDMGVKYSSTSDLYVYLNKGSWKVSDGKVIKSVVAKYGDNVETINGMTFFRHDIPEINGNTVVLTEIPDEIPCSVSFDTDKEYLVYLNVESIKF